jgi:hypothetical protein
MRVLVTGMIAVMDDESYIDQVLQMGKDEGTDISYYNLIAALESTGGKKLDRLLGTTNYLFEVLREREIRKIGFELEANNITNAIIRVPATIEWRHVNIKLKDDKEIAQFIKPDVVVTLIDAEWFIQDRMQDSKKRDEFFKRVRERDFSIREILSWMNEEVSLAEDWAAALKVRHYVIPVGQKPESLYQLVRHERVPSFYVSYSMTHSNQSAREEVDTVISQLNKYGLVIDPQAIEIDTSFDSERDKEVTFAYTVHRDLHWFVGKVDAVVAIHPYAERPPLSTGMMDELGHARDYLKRRYMIYPPTNLSPFTTDSYIEQGHIFTNAEEFFLCLEAEGFQPLPSG